MINSHNMMASDIRLTDEKFSETIMDRHKNLSLFSSDFTILSKKLLDYPRRSPNLTHLWPLALKHTILNKYLQVFSKISPSKFWFDILKKAKESIKNRKYSNNNEFLSINKNLTSVTYKLNRSHTPTLKKSHDETFQIPDEFKTIINKNRRLFTIERTNASFPLKNVEKQIKIDLRSSKSNSLTSIARDTLFTTNIISKNYNINKNYHETFDKDKILNNVLKEGSIDYHDTEISRNQLFYSYGEIEHLKTFQRQADNEKIIETIENEPNSEFPTTQVQTTVLDVNRVADQVYNIIERKIKIERERRGLFG